MLVAMAYFAVAEYKLTALQYYNTTRVGLQSPSGVIRPNHICPPVLCFRRRRLEFVLPLLVVGD